MSREVEPLSYNAPKSNAPRISKPINNTDVIEFCYSLLGATSYGEIYNLHALVVDKNLENSEQRTCQEVARELAVMFSYASKHLYSRLKMIFIMVLIDCSRCF